MIKYLNEPVLRKYKGKICLLRVDLNNVSRLEAVAPTIKLLLKNGIKIVILSHRGRPPLKITLKPFAASLSKKIKKPVVFIGSFDFKRTRKQIENSKHRVFLLENLRFLPGEEKNDVKLAKILAGLGDFYVNDAFAVSHRKNASVAAITKYLPSYGGLLLEKEIKNLDAVMKKYRHPFTIIIGGAKIPDKIGIIKNLWNKADYFLLGGGPANTFFAAQGLPVGDSLIDEKLKIKIKKYLNSPKILLPSDVKISGRKILDIGDGTVLWYSTIIRKSRTIIWNGPMGLFEKKGFEKGTVGIWKAILTKSQKLKTKSRVIVGGGETIASLARITRIHTDKNGLIRIKHPHKSAKISTNPRLFLSTGGGAMLEYLSGKKLPGIACLARLAFGKSKRAEARSEGGKR